jgi:hypothetical protein
MQSDLSACEDDLQEDILQVLLHYKYCSKDVHKQVMPHSLQTNLTVLELETNQHLEDPEENHHQKSWVLEGHLKDQVNPQEELQRASQHHLED